LVSTSDGREKLKPIFPVNLRGFLQHLISRDRLMIVVKLIPFLPDLTQAKLNVVVDWYAPQVLKRMHLFQ
jgi:hypothetical protein